MDYTEHDIERRFSARTADKDYIDPLVIDDYVTDVDEAEDFTESDDISDALLWLLLLAAVAECITNCFTPSDWFTQSYHINITATAINFIGAFLDGVLYLREKNYPTCTTIIPPMQFRSSFLGVLTSYSYMVDHAGDLSGINFILGPLYILGSLLGGCVAFRLGKLASQRISTLSNSWRISNRKFATLVPSVRIILLVFVSLTLIRASFGQPGFVSDPTNPKFIRDLKVADGEELIVGIFMSCSAVLVGNAINVRAQDNLPHNIYSIQWASVMCNAVACTLTIVVYIGGQLSTRAFKTNFLMSKFVASFCGSLSGYSDAIHSVMTNVEEKRWNTAVWNFFAHVMLALACIPYLYKNEIS